MTGIQNDLGLRIAASLAGIDRRDVDAIARRVAGRPIASLVELTDEEARAVSMELARMAGHLPPPRHTETVTAFPDYGFDHRNPDTED